MNDIKFKPHRGRVQRTGPEMAAYLRQVAGDNAGERDRMKKNLIRAIREELTPRQRQVLTMRYARNMPVKEIARELGVWDTTVYRTIRRGEGRLFRCLRYGAVKFLREEDP